MQIKEAEVNEIIHLKLGWKKVPFLDEEGNIIPECPKGWAWENPNGGGQYNPDAHGIVPDYYGSQYEMIEVLKTLNRALFYKFIKTLNSKVIIGKLPDDLQIKDITISLTLEELMTCMFFLDPKEAAKAFLKLFDIDVVEEPVEAIKE